MKDKLKPNIQPSGNITPAAKQEQKGQNKIFLGLSLLLLLVLLISMMIPVYYVPLFNNISAKYGLSVDVSRKLNLLDLALSSFGIETPNVAAAFKKYKFEYEPDVFYSSRFNVNSKSRLINAKETYYHEYERTHKRPPEIAGIYQNGKEANTPVIDGDLKGVRALPKDSSADFGDNSFTGFSYKNGAVSPSIRDEIMGSTRRKVRGSFDKSGQDGDDKKSKREPLPDFASSIYSQDAKEGETQTLENSRMVKPLVQKEEFVVINPDNVISKLIGDKSFTDTFAAMTNFGGYGGALGYYVKDNLPQFNMLDFFKSSGKQVFTSYLYSHAAVGREYVESAKYLAEKAFHGDEPINEILIAKGQKKDKVPTMDPADMSPIELVLTVRRNMRECNEAGERYVQEVAPLRTAYENAKAKLRKISHGDSVDGLENVAVAGVPGSCEEYTWTPFGQTAAGRRTFRLRNKWNNLVDEAKKKCVAIRNKERTYAEACKMNYSNDPNKDTCEAIEDLRVKGGTDWWEFFQGICRANVIWQWPNFHHAKTFHGCGGLEMWDSQGEIAASNDCETKQNHLFNEIDANVQLQAKDGFVFVD